MLYFISVQLNIQISQDSAISVTYFTVSHKCWNKALKH